MSDQRQPDPTPASPIADERTQVALERLLRESAAAWGLIARVTRDDAGTLRVAGLGHDILIRPAARDLPFRWIVSLNGRERPAVSVVAVLRMVRRTLDPTYRGARALAPG